MARSVNKERNNEGQQVIDQPVILRKDSICPAKLADGKSSAVALFRTATPRFFVSPFALAIGKQ
jgi:hypothetical protein